MKHIVRILARAAVALVGFVVVLGSLGFLYQTIRTSEDKRKFPPVGQLIDVSGYKMHLYCTGQAHAGTPTVVLESGQANPTAAWAWVQPEVAKWTRVCAYDRAGVGHSEPSPNPRDAKRIATELHTLLSNAGIPGPYVLVAHSFGGFVTHVYAAEYPQDVAGMVWIDVEHPGQWTRTPQGQTQYQSILSMGQLGRWVAPIGLVRLSNFIPLITDLPAQQAAEFKAWTDSTQFMSINYAEFEAQPESAAQATEAGSLGDLPLIVLTATDHGFPAESSAVLERDWLEMQDELAALSSNSEHQVINDTNHGSLQLTQKDAANTVDAIRHMLDKVGAPKV